MIEQANNQTMHILKPDTQAVLLLCGRFGRLGELSAKPLTQAEYDKLATWLHSQGMRPADLLGADGVSKLEEAGAELNLESTRLARLLERGGTLALAVEGWANKGIWVISRSDEHYPPRLKGRLGPPIVYGVGRPELLALGGLAIVGSREADAEALHFTRRVAGACAEQNIQVVSGGARGVDTEAMMAALEGSGSSIAVLSDSLTRMAVSGKYRDALLKGSLTFISPYDPDAGFDVGNAMGRNKHVYGLADWALIVSTSFGKGGTWAGATEALKSGRKPILVRPGKETPEGNIRLLALGAIPFPSEPWTDLANRLMDAWAEAQSHNSPDEYAVVLPSILMHLAEPRDVKYLADTLGVRPTQMVDWLDRAVADHRVVKKGRPPRFMIAQPQFDLGV